MSGNNTGLAAVHAAAGGETISREQYEQDVAAARAEGLAAGRAEAQASARADGVKEGAAAERARIAGIEAHALPGHEALIAEMKADGATTPDQAAGRILGAEKARRGTEMRGIADVERHTGGVASAPVTQSNRTPGDSKAILADKTLSVEERCKAAWEVDPGLRAEFGTLSTFTAFQRADEAGSVRILRGKAA